MELNNNRMTEYLQTDQLQEFIDWKNIMPMDRYAGGHDEQMKGLFKDVEVIAHYNEGDYQGQVATCVKFTKGKFKGKYAIYNDYYGSCSGCDAWEYATDDMVRKLCIDLANSAYIFKNLDDVKLFLFNPDDEGKQWNRWGETASSLLSNILSGKID